MGLLVWLPSTRHRGKRGGNNDLDIINQFIEGTSIESIGAWAYYEETSAVYEKHAEFDETSLILDYYE